MQKNISFIKKDIGSALVEYALIAPMFFLVFFSVFEISSIFFVQTSMESAVLEISRFGRTGDSEDGSTQTETAQRLFSELTYGMTDPSKLYMHIMPVGDFASLQPMAITEDYIDFGSPEESIIYILSYAWDFFTPGFADALGLPSGIQLSACTVVINETRE